MESSFLGIAHILVSFGDTSIHETLFNCKARKVCQGLKVLIVPKSNYYVQKILEARCDMDLWIVQVKGVEE